MQNARNVYERFFPLHPGEGNKVDYMTERSEERGTRLKVRAGILEMTPNGSDESRYSLVFRGRVEAEGR